MLLATQGDVSNITRGTGYSIVTGNVIPGDASNLPFQVTGGQGAFTRWEVTSEAFTLYAGAAIPVTGDSSTDNFVHDIITTSPINSDAGKVVNVIDHTPLEGIKPLVNHLLPKIERPSKHIHRTSNTTPSTGTGANIGSGGRSSNVVGSPATGGTGGGTGANIGSGGRSSGGVGSPATGGTGGGNGVNDTGRQDVSNRTSEIRGAENESSQGQSDDTARSRVAPSSGDEGNKVVYGVWGAPYIGVAKQKEIDKASGYKSKSVGGSIGVDTAINDNITLGGSYTHINTKLKYQDEKAGNVTKVNTDIFSLYGLYNFQSNWFVEGIASYSRSIIKTSEQRNVIEGIEIARAKYRSLSYSTQAVGGYNYFVRDYVISPMAGLRATKIKDSGFTEHGTSFQNLTVNKRQYNKVEGIAGVEIKTSLFWKGMLIKPQVHGFINYDITGSKAPPITAHLDGLPDPLPITQVSANKTTYNLGTGVEITKGRMNYGIHYGLNLSQKYLAQSGTLTIKVNF